MQTQKILQNIVLACLMATSWNYAPLFSTDITSVDVTEAPPAKDSVNVIEAPLANDLECKEHGLLAKPTKKQKALQQKNRRKIVKAEKHLRKNMPKDAIAKCWFNNCTNYAFDGLHFVHDRSPTGDTIEIENGAVFSVRDWDSSTVASWLKKTEIRITNNSWGSSRYEFKIVNTLTGATAQANISLAPFVASPNTRRIYTINLANGTVTLDNGRTFKVSNISTISGWKGIETITGYAGDMIIVGDNDSWITKGYNSVLFNLNVPTNTSVSAYCVQ